MPALTCKYAGVCPRGRHPNSPDAPAPRPPPPPPPRRRPQPHRQQSAAGPTSPSSLGRRVPTRARLNPRIGNCNTLTLWRAKPLECEFEQICWTSADFACETGGGGVGTRPQYQTGGDFGRPPDPPIAPCGPTHPPPIYPGDGSQSCVYRQLVFRHQDTGKEQRPLSCSPAEGRNTTRNPPARKS